MDKSFTIKGTLVKDHKHKCSFNLTNKIDAITLFNILTEYENEQRHNQNYHELKHEILNLHKDLQVVQDDLIKIKELIE